MNTRQRNHEEESRQPGETPENPGEDSALHAQSQHFLNIGNQIIQSALSGNSQDFLAASRQQGGQ